VEAKNESGWCHDASIDEPEEDGWEKSSDVMEAKLAGPAPKCAGCGDPMTALAIFHKHPERLPLAHHEALGVFVCTREAGDDWDAWWESCAVANAANAKGGLTAVLYEEPPKLKKKTGQAVYYQHREDSEPEVVGAGEEIVQRVGGTKLGGAPYVSTAIDSIADQTCKQCGAPMRFVAQVGSMSGLDFEAGDGFHIYVYLCPNDERHGAVTDAFVD
jgi:hypothetical protein